MKNSMEGGIYQSVREKKKGSRLVSKWLCLKRIDGDFQKKMPFE